MTKTALQFLEDRFAAAQRIAIKAINDYRLTQEAYDTKRRAGAECSMEYAAHRDAARWETCAAKYASDCLSAIEAARKLDIKEG
jgi:hypothetical protein